MNDEIKLMLSTPGIYAVSGPGFGESHSLHVMVEVEANGNCHQLTPEGKRDGLLDQRGWNGYAQVYTVAKDSQGKDVFTRLQVGHADSAMGIKTAVPGGQLQ